MPQLTGVDHVLIGVRDLARAKAAYERLGFVTTPLAAHDAWGTANHCVMFEGDYLELIGVVDPARFTNGLDAFLAGREGVSGIAYATADAGRCVAALRAAGIAAEGPDRLGRPAGAARAEFALVRWPPEAAPGLAAFACQHLTPAALRPPGTLAHPNGAVGIAALTVIVDDPPALVSAYETLFGAGSIALTDDTVAVHTGGSVLVFGRPDDASLLHPEVELPDLAPPYVLAVTLAVRDLAKLRALLKRNKVKVAADRDDALTVGAGDACGAILEFTQVD